jgi:hypothetical protein
MCGRPSLLAWVVVACGLLLTIGCSDDTKPEDDRISVSSVMPSSNASGVEVSASISISFSKPVAPATVSTATILITPAIPYSVSCTGSTVTVTHPNPLAFATTYRITVKKEVTDVDGTSMKADYSSQFTTKSAPPFLLNIPFQAGATWAYRMTWHTTVSAWSTGIQQYSFTGHRYLYTIADLTYQGRSAYQLVMLDTQDDFSGDAQFTVAQMFVSPSADGLDKWVDMGSSHSWRRILSSTQATFDNCAFLVAGDPSNGQRMNLSNVPVTVPAGSYQSVLARHTYTETDDQYPPPADIFETREEYFVDGIGPVKAVWDYSYDDNDPRGTDVSTGGTAELEAAGVGDGGPVPWVRVEVEPNDGPFATSLPAVPSGGFVIGDTHIMDPGFTLTDGDLLCYGCVGPNENGQYVFQDWFQMDHPSAGPLRVDLTYEYYSYEHGEWADVDIFLFLESPPGQLTFAGKSMNEQGKPERIQLLDAEAGTYILAVQAWKATQGRYKYWLRYREP